VRRAGPKRADLFGAEGWIKGEDSGFEGNETRDHSRPIRRAHHANSHVTQAWNAGSGAGRFQPPASRWRKGGYLAGQERINRGMVGDLVDTIVGTLYTGICCLRAAIRSTLSTPMP